MTKTTKTIEELLESQESPLPLDVIPNRMGINLVSVKSISWGRREDGQLTDLSINFCPSDSPPTPTEGGEAE